MDDPQDIDRAAILARRQRFVLMALGGLSGVPGCERSSSCDAPTVAPSFETSHHALVTQAAPASEPFGERECDDPFLAEMAARSSPDLDEEQRAELAKAGFERGEQAHSAGDHACAIALYERAYLLVPGKHRFAFVIGEVASEIASEPWACALAHEYLEHFLTYADPDHDGTQIERARAILSELEQQGCDDGPVFPEPYSEPMPCLSMAPDPEPFAPPRNCARPQRKR